MAASPRAWAIAVLVVLIILIVAAVGAGRAMMRRYDHYLSGMWAADPAFLQKASLSDMQLYISPASRAAPDRKGYLIMVNAEGDFLVNQAITVEAAFEWKSALGTLLKPRHDACDGRATMRVLEGQGAEGGAKQPFPSRLRLTLSMGDGVLTLRDDEKIWALLIKDFEASTAAKAAWEEKPAPG
jgi:hypothetical protein